MIYAAEYLNMPWLAHVKPWAGLFLFALASSYWNWKAALAFMTCIFIARFSVGYLPQPIVGITLGYSCAAAACVFFWDWKAGVVLAVISLLAVVRFWVPAFVIVSEVAFIAGVVWCGWSGGSGGILEHNPTSRSGGPAADYRGGPVVQVSQGED